MSCEDQQPQPPVVSTVDVADPGNVVPSESLSDLSSPQLLHPSSIFFEAAAHIKQYIVPAALGMFGVASGNVWGLGIAGSVFGISLLVTLVRYATLRYRIVGNDFIVTEGLLVRRVRSVPIRRIQNVDLVQNILHRMFDVAVVNIETASGAQAEATLRVLTMKQVEQLRRAIFGVQHTLSNAPSAGDAHRAASSSDAAHQTLAVDHGQSADKHASGLAESEPAIPEPATPRLLWEIPTSLLTLAGLASNRGMVLLGILFGFFFQQGFDEETFPQQIAEAQWSEWIPSPLEKAGVVIQIAIGLVFLLVVLRVVGIAWYILRFHGYRLTRSGDDLHISCGLFTRVSATVPRRRIQFVSVHRALLMRPFGLAAIRIETAGGGGHENEDAAATVSRRWFIPVIRQSEVPFVLSQLRPELEWREADVHWHGLAPRAGERMLRLAVIASVVAAALGLAITRPWGWLLGVILLPVFAVLARKKARSRRYARLPWGVAYHSGVITHKLSFSFYDRIQTLLYTQTPFDRRWRMASLQVDTAAAGPADHSISIDYLEADVARAQFEDLQRQAAAHRPTWN